MTTDTKPLAWFSWSLNSNTGLSTSGSQDGITPEMYGAIMGVLAGRFPEAEIARLQAQVAELAFLVQTAPTFFSAHSFDGEKLLWLKRAGLVPKDAK